MTFKEMCDKYGFEITVCDAFSGHDGFEIMVDHPREDWHYRHAVTGFEMIEIESRGIDFENWVCESVIGAFARRDRRLTKPIHKNYLVGFDMSGGRDISVATEFKVVNNRYVNVKSFTDAEAYW